MLINHTSKQVTAKIVYYGTGLGGKDHQPAVYLFRDQPAHAR